MAQVTWTRPAQRQVHAIQRHIAQNSSSAAAAMVRWLRADVDRLRRFPESGRIVREYTDPGIREVIVAPYRVLYRYLPSQDRVQIIAVVHGSRLLPPLEDES